MNAKTPGGRALPLPSLRRQTINGFCIFFVVVSAACPGWCLAQKHEGDSAMQKAIRLEREFREREALECYLGILRAQPDHAGALAGASRLYARIGGRLTEHAEKKEHIIKARSLACRAIALDAADTEAHFRHVVALGLLSEMADNPAERLESARLIKSEAERILALDPEHAGIHYVLGKWHHALSRLTWIEELLGATLLGGIPAGASREEASRCFQRAIDLDPGYILFYYGMATMLADNRQHSQAITLLTRALSLPMREPDDHVRLINCKRLLERLKSLTPQHP